LLSAESPSLLLGVSPLAFEDMNGIITSYEITMTLPSPVKPVGVIDPSHDLEYRFSDLTPSTSYSFVVTAKTAAGTSVASASASFSTLNSGWYR
jgi:hypothetical protein